MVANHDPSIPTGIAYRRRRSQMMAGIWKGTTLRLPVDRLAARQLQKGDPDPRPSALGDKPALVPQKFLDHLKKQASFEDLTGQVFGYLTVLGLYIHDAKVGRPWVCRCVCGRYAKYQRRTLTKGIKDRCDSCDLAQQSRSGGLPPKNQKENPKPPPYARWETFSDSVMPSIKARIATLNSSFIGKKFGDLVVVGQSTHETSGRNDTLLWVCKCQCGRFVFRPRERLISRKSTPCPVCKPLPLKG